MSRNSAYKQEGMPENVSPYPGKVARVFGVTKPKPQAVKPAPAAKPAAKPTVREPAFTVAGAPKEPADEIPLSTRAKRLAAWVEAHPRRTPANVNHWLYQHNWIVSGAKFGWSHGAESLRTLVAVDERVQKLWGVGKDSEAVARKALVDVKASSR